jgi:primosomal protein N' (replication factor Y)
MQLSEPYKLNRLQSFAYGEILSCFREKDVCLLHGVTSAGKTEIYIHLIDETLRLGRQVLFLLPEIALTAQITGRLRKVFGNKLGVYHSRINDNERVEIWNNMLEDDSFQVILGVRSSIFLPFRDLGLVIVDEEHETGYKQQDPAPRYHARNAAIVLATMHGAKVLLGSATPSLESFYNAQTGKYAYVRLDKRFENVEMPEIIPVNIKELRRKKRMKGLFSPVLTEEIQSVLDKEEQIILFQNRRGFAPMIFCKTCDWIPKCNYCDVSLTYHKNIEKLACHYCGSTYKLPRQCPDCGNEDLRPRGFGTEKVEEEITSLFPGVRIARMDTDTTHKKNAYEEIIHGFESGKTQILIGTQMVSKGLDFDNVGLVGILNADSMMGFPDFRAHERAFQLMAQVAGRAGRKKNGGKVILQTSHPEHPLIQLIINNDYEGMYRLQMEERSLFRYPPLYRIIEITLKHKRENTLDNCAKEYAALLRSYLGNRILGPDKPIIGKIQTYYLRRILMKIEITASLSRLREILEETRNQLLRFPEFKYITVQFDVDPM